MSGVSLDALRFAGRVFPAPGRFGFRRRAARRTSSRSLANSELSRDVLAVADAVFMATCRVAIGLKLLIGRDALRESPLSRVSSARLAIFVRP
jgi:hypothetical protein